MHLMLAAYDPDGRMCAMIDGDLTIEPGGTGFKSLTYTAEQQVNTVKIFLVDPGTMEPPGSVFTITDAAPAIKAA